MKHTTMYSALPRALFFILFLGFLLPATTAQPYPASSYKLDDSGKRLEEWLGDETDIDMESDPVLQKVLLIDNRAFKSRTSPISIILPAGLKAIGNWAFSECINLSAVKMGDAVAEIGLGAFHNCARLKTIALSRGLQILGAQAFLSSGIVSINIPAAATIIGSGAFFLCKNLKSITVDDANPNYRSADGVLFTKGADNFLWAYPNAKGRRYEIPAGTTAVGHYAFAGCVDLQEVNIPSSVSEVGQFAFSGCKSLAAVGFSSGVEHIYDRAFYGCSELKNVHLPESLISIGALSFAECIMLGRVQCDAKTPPTCNREAFSGIAPDAGTLIVPEGALEVYRTTVPWSLFGKIETVQSQGSTIVKFVTNKTVGTELSMRIEAVGEIETQGAERISKNTFKLTAQTVILKGNISVVDCPSAGLTALEVCGAPLKQLICDDNELQTIVVSEAPGLEIIYCGNNRLARLNIQGCPALRELSCWGNRLIQTDLSGFPDLQALICRNNRLETLDLSANAKLWQLSCNENVLREIKMPENGSLRHLECMRNRIQGDEMRAIVNALPQYVKFGADEWDDYMGYNPQGLFLVDETGETGNIAEKAEVEIAKAKGWPVWTIDLDKYGEEKPKVFDGWPDAVGSIDDTAIRLYPNPADEFINIDNAGCGMEIRIISLEGKTVLSVGRISGEQIRIDLRSLPCGAYIVVIGKEYRPVVIRR